MREVELSGGKRALVDDADFELVSRWRWKAVRRGTRWYAQRNTKQGGIYMHRFLLQAAAGSDVDHINGDGLDNQRANLRECSRGDNNRNARSPGGRSRFRGVYFNKAANKWQAYMRVAKRCTYLGVFALEEDAARARDAAARRLYPEFSRFNFPLAGERQA